MAAAAQRQPPPRDYAGSVAVDRPHVPATRVNPVARRVRRPPAGRRDGATALEVITRTATPVVLVPPDARPLQLFARLLLPIEGTSELPPALSEIIDAAPRRKPELIVLHLHSPATVPAFSDHEPHRTRAWDQEFLARHLAFAPDRLTVLRHVGTPADDVSVAAERTGADLIVLVWSHSFAKGRARVVTRTLASTNIPVLLLPAEPSIHRVADSVHRSTTTKSRARM